jgi:peptidoglycan/xylan/chitin deacetylase (PgdA/CDA1 family)
MTTGNDIYVSWTMDCEATQKAFDDVDMGIRSIRGFVDLLLGAGLRGTLFVLPGDAAAYPDLVRDCEEQGFEIGLHFHPHEEGYDDFCGGFTAQEQTRMYRDGIKKFADAVGFVPKTFRTGSASANDATLPVMAELGFKSCSTSIPGRDMKHLRSNWVGAPQYVHYAHASNRLLEGGLDLVDVPMTTDPDSMLWSGGHPQDLRVELFDAKNQWYMIDKMLAREKTRSHPVKAIVPLTHNMFDYSDPADFRHETMQRMIADFVDLAGKHEVNLIPATIGEIAASYRSAVPADACGAPA